MSDGDESGRNRRNQSFSKATWQRDRPVSVPNLDGLVIARLLCGDIHGSLIGWTFDQRASAKVLVSVDKEQSIGRHDLPRHVVSAKRRWALLQISNARKKVAHSSATKF
jgi:hypothetical protein